MGICIELWRARIGSFRGRSKVKEPFLPIDLEFDHSLSDPLPPYYSMSWKSSCLGLLLLLISALCHSQLLLMGGVESNPGPTTVDDILAELAIDAPNESVRDCIRLYRKEATTIQHRKTFGQKEKELLVETMDYLGVPNQADYLKDSVVNNLIVRIQNLLPDECRFCKVRYCTKLGEPELLLCSVCKQAAHVHCVVQATGLDHEIINSLKPAGIHYLCRHCEEDRIPSPEAGKLKNRRNPESDKTEPSGGPPEDPSQGPPPGDQGQTVPPQGPQPGDQGNQTVPPQGQQPGSSANHTITPQGRPGQDTNVRQEICSFFKRGTCRFGLSGKGCSYQHPKACPKLIEHGNREPRGCTKGKDCDHYHPKMCQQSLRAGECLTLDCKLRHVQGTKRTTSKTRPQSQDSRGFNQNRYQQSRRDKPDIPDSNSRVDFLEMMKTMQAQFMSAMQTNMAQLSQQINFVASQLPQNRMPQSQMLQNQMPQNQMPQNQMPQSQMPQSQMPQSQMNPSAPNPWQVAQQQTQLQHQLPQLNQGQMPVHLIRC